MGLGDAEESRILPATVVIPTWRRPTWLDRSLRAVKDQEPPPEEILVVGRDDDDETRRVVEQFRDVRWAAVTRGGHVEPLRVALREVRTPFLVILDDDAIPRSSDWLARLLEPFDSNVACVGGQVWNVGETNFRVRRKAGLLSWYGRVAGNVARRTDPAPREVDSVQEANWAWRTDVLKTVRIASIWDDGDATMYGLELCLQARSLGWSVLFTPRAPVDHFLAPRDASLPRADHERAAFAYSRNMTYIALKHFRLRLVPYVFWTLAVGEQHHYGVLRAALDLATGQRGIRVILASVRGRVEGFRLWQREALLKS